MTGIRGAIVVLVMTVLSVAPAHGGSTRTVECDIESGPCRAITDSGLEVLFSISPRPVLVMEDLEFTVLLARKGNPVSGAAIHLDLSMPGMFMGRNQPKLEEEPGGRYRGHGAIPRCVTGQRTWQAFIAVRHDGRVEKVSVLFEVR